VRPRFASERLRTEALLLRSVALRDADLLVTLLTPDRGIVEAGAPSARKSSKRFEALEPVHLLRVTLEVGERRTRLVEAAIERARTRILRSLEALEGAGRALRWTREAMPLGAADPVVWARLGELLDELDAGAPPKNALAARGLALLASWGYGVELEACARCGRAVPPKASASFDLGAGGVVCRACGGGPEILRDAERLALAAAQRGELDRLPDGAAARALAWIDERLRATR
jgi:DNA repair protein RecO (recombination protein O)